jgi:hypothetical protein
MSDVAGAASASPLIHQHGTTLAPAYNAGGSSINSTKNQPCSMYPDEFCFLCEFQGSAKTDGLEVDLYTAIIKLCKELSAQKREVSQIAYHVYEMYVTTIQVHVDSELEWTKESIVRHLLHSGQFQPVFDDSVRSMFTSLITLINGSLVDVDSGQVVKENVKLFCETVKHFSAWKKSM